MCNRDLLTAKVNAFCDRVWDMSGDGEDLAEEIRQYLESSPKDEETVSEILYQLEDAIETLQGISVFLDFPLRVK